MEKLRGILNRYRAKPKLTRLPPGITIFEKGVKQIDKDGNITVISRTIYSGPAKENPFSWLARNFSNWLNEMGVKV